jgi:hypothetical protein
VALLLTIALYAGLSAQSPAAADAGELRDPFAARASTVEAIEPTSPELVDPFTRPRAATIARSTTELSDPFAARRADHGLRDPFASDSPAPRLASASTVGSELADPFAARPSERASSSSSPDLHDPFAR